MPDFPVMLRVAGRRCVIVGGGPVALRRARSLLEAGAEVVIIAPQIDADLAALPVACQQRPYQAGDANGAMLIVIASSDPAVNARAAHDAAAAGALVNRADDADEGDLRIPAHAHHGPITLAVHTSGISATAAGAIRRELSAALDADWLTLLELVAPYRTLIQQRVSDARERQRRLAQLAGDEAMAILKSQGRDALRDYCERWATPASSD